MAQFERGVQASERHLWLLRAGLSCLTSSSSALPMARVDVELLSKRSCVPFLSGSCKRNASCHTYIRDVSVMLLLCVHG